jgi:membrane fusion protein (multidrug efflux system)
MSGRFWFVLLLVGLAAGVAYHYWPRPQQTAAAPAGAPPGGFAMPVEAAKVSLETVTQSIPAVGSLRSAESVVISSEVAGRVSKLNINEGAAVTKGTVLAEIAPEVYEAELAQAEARLTLSRRNYDRAQELQKQGAGTIRALDEASSNLRNDQATLELAKAYLGKTKIIAPFDGVLGLRKISIGAYVEAGNAIVNLDAINPVKVDFRIPEVSLASLYVGQSVDVILAAFRGKTFHGEVVAIDPAADMMGRSIMVRAQIPNPDGQLKPGLFAQVNLIVEKRNDAKLVPERALMPVGDNQFVYKIVEGKATRTQVKIGIRQEGRVEIVEGLGPEDSVVTDGQIKLADGMPVMVLNAQPPAGAGPNGQAQGGAGHP